MDSSDSRRSTTSLPMALDYRIRTYLDPDVAFTHDVGDFGP